ncbi:hypothetical protein TRFO_09139 [Tritrichomonas foetus]|uniref:Uncharacterized protein n=1 Tax=Tritrichomonas foetus TaxID=1144522 RepID=A0A1J4JI64_9EUKA|nr:hypothetical protein TRFO_09139 [Tritrichomonas foetus]|eukprot:OHS97983.1 hypothetical protein TRFO_09139 [Tritrichomonas foetus]
MSDFVKYSVISNIDFLIDQKSTERPTFKQVAANDQLIASLGQTDNPFISQIKDIYFHEFTNINPFVIDPIALALYPKASDSKYLITSHESSAITVWDISKLTVNKFFPRIGKPIINELCYQFDSNIFYGGDEAGNLIEFTLSSFVGILSIKETLLVETTLPIMSIIHVTPTFFVITNISNVILYDKGLQNHAIVFEIPEGKNAVVSFKDWNLMICYDSFLTSIKIDKKLGFQIVFQYDIGFQAIVSNLFILSPNLYAFSLSNKTITITDSKGDIILECENSKLADIFDKGSLFFSVNESIYGLATNSFTEILFLNWQDLINQYSYLSLWHECIYIAETVYSGYKPPFFGIPLEPIERCSMVQKVMKPVMTKLMKESINQFDIEMLVSSAAKLEMAEFLLVDLLCDLSFKDKKIPMYTAIFCSCSDVMMQYISIYNIEQFFHYFNSINKLHLAEDMMLESNIPHRYIPHILKLCQQFELGRLLMHILCKVTKDFVSAAKYQFLKGKLYEFSDDMYLKKKDMYEEIERKRVLIWILTPVAGTFPRLQSILAKNWIRSSLFISEFSRLCPIILLDGTTLDHRNLIDCVLRTIVLTEYEIALPLIEAILPFLIQIKEPKIPACIIPYIIRWAFTSNSYLTTRETILLLIEEQYPKSIDFTKLLPFCISLGFSRIVTEIGNYAQIIKSMTIDQDNRHLAFLYISKQPDSDDLKNAIYVNFTRLTLVSPAESMYIVVNRFPDLHIKIMRDEGNRFAKWFYLRHLFEASEGKKVIMEKDIVTFFDLACEFEPERALPILKSGHQISYEEALPYCKKFGVLDAQIFIHTVFGNFSEAVKLMSDDIQRELIRAIRFERPIVVQSIDTIRECERLKNACNDVEVAFDLLAQAPPIGDSCERMWTQIYTGFQLPVWLLRKCQFPATKKAVTFFFSYFVVESLNRCNAKFIMTTLYRYFSATERPVYHSVLETVFNHLEYRQMLNKTMLDLMRYDCLELYNNSIYVTNRGTMIPSVNCCVCQMPIDGGRGVGMLAFECGHCFHDNTRCGGFKVCPLCQGNFVNQIQPEIINVTEKGRQIQ